MANQTQSNQSLSSPASNPEAGPGLRLLHIDDNADDLTLFELACEQAGVPLRCRSARSAAEARSFLESLLDRSRTELVNWPDVVLLDLVMPGRTGLELLRDLRSIPALERLPIVAFTGDTNPVVLDEVYRTGANSCLPKPLTFDQMTEVARLLYAAWSMALRPSPPGGVR